MRGGGHCLCRKPNYDYYHIDCSYHYHTSITVISLLTYMWYDTCYRLPFTHRRSYLIIFVLPHNAGFFKKGSHPRWISAKTTATLAHPFQCWCVQPKAMAAWGLDNPLVAVIGTTQSSHLPDLIAFSGEGLRWIVGMVLTSMSWGVGRGWHAKLAYWGWIDDKGWIDDEGWTNDEL